MFRQQVEEYLNLSISQKQENTISLRKEGGSSLEVLKYKEIVIKVPEPEDYDQAVEGYTLAYKKGFISNLYVEGCQIIIPFIQGESITSILKDMAIQKLYLLWEKMYRSEFYLSDWTIDNLLLHFDEVVVIDWGYWDLDSYQPEMSFNRLQQII